jgi:hypothetical protein
MLAVKLFPPLLDVTIVRLRMKARAPVGHDEYPVAAAKPICCVDPEFIENDLHPAVLSGEHAPELLLHAPIVGWPLPVAAQPAGTPPVQK